MATSKDFYEKDRDGEEEEALPLASSNNPEFKRMQSETELTRLVVQDFISSKISQHVSPLDGSGEEPDWNLASPGPHHQTNAQAMERASQEELRKAIAAKLQNMGDEIYRKHEHEFDHMVQALNLNDGLNFDKFMQISSRLFENGINLGRIISLMCFGYKLARAVLSKGMAGFKDFLKNIAKHVVRVMVNEGVIKWLCDHGGWMNVVNPLEQSADVWVRRGLCAVAILAIVGVVVYHRKNT